MLQHCRELRQSERGAIMMLALFLLVLLFAVLGAAIDSGNLYQARLQLQKAADTGAMGGMASTFLQDDQFRGLDPAAQRNFVETRARALAMQNLQQNGIQTALDDIEAEYVRPTVDAAGRPVNGRLSVRVEAAIPFWLIDRVPMKFFGAEREGNSLVLSAVASTERQPANVMLVLDVSNSMRCLSGADADNCTCLTPSRVEGRTCEQIAAETPGATQRIVRLQTATRRFVRGFMPDFDRLAIIPFNIVGSTAMRGDGAPPPENVNFAVRFRPFNGDNVEALAGFDFDDNPATDDEVSASIDSFAPRSNTNLSDALLRAYQEARRVNLFNQENVLYLVFSDGAPTAGRFLLTDAAVGGRPLPARARDGWLSTFDYTIYSIYWQPQLANTPDIPEEFRNLVYAGPSPLIFTGDLRINQNTPTPEASWVPPCSEAALQPLAHQRVFRNCLQSFQSQLPEGAGSSKIYNSQYTIDRFFNFEGAFDPAIIPTLDAAGLRFWREMFFNSALEIADFLRQRRGTVFTIGLGEESIPANDAYQFAENLLSGVDELQTGSFERKDVTLSRLANAYTYATETQQKAGRANYPDFPYAEHDSYETLNETPGVQAGEYFPTEASINLDEAFDAARLALLMRLIR